MNLDDETLLMLAGGALVVGLIIRHKLKAGAADLEDVAPIGSTPLPAPIPVPTWPGQVHAPLPSPPPAPAPPPPPVQTAAEANAAFDASMAIAHAQQADDLARGIEALKAQVASGAIVVGSPEYASKMDYLANLRGGVATKDAEMAAIRAQGLAGRRPRLRIVR